MAVRLQYPEPSSFLAILFMGTKSSPRNSLRLSFLSLSPISITPIFQKSHLRQSTIRFLIFVLFNSNNGSTKSKTSSFGGAVAAWPFVRRSSEANRYISHSIRNLYNTKFTLYVLHFLPFSSNLLIEPTPSARMGLDEQPPAVLIKSPPPVPTKGKQKRACRESRGRLKDFYVNKVWCFDFSEMRYV